MRNNYTRKLETPIGTFYLEYGYFGDSYIHCALLDSDKKWITNLYHKSTINKLKNITSIGDIVEICGLQTCDWALTLKDLAEVINDTYFWDKWAEEYVVVCWKEKDIANYDFLNRVGDTYFIVDFE